MQGRWVSAILFGQGSFILRGAFDIDIALGGNEVEDMTRTGFDAGSAGSALFRIEMRMPCSLIQMASKGQAFLQSLKPMQPQEQGVWSIGDIDGRFAGFEPW